MRSRGRRCGCLHGLCSERLRVHPAEIVPAPAAKVRSRWLRRHPPQPIEPTQPTAEVTLNDVDGQQVATAQLREQAEGVMVTLNAARLPGGQGIPFP